MGSLKEAIVLGGGLGTRLRSVQPHLPKILVPIAGRPFLSFVLDYLAREGIERVLLSLGYRAEQVLEWLRTQRFSMEVMPVVEAEPLGTGGALAYAWQAVVGEKALMMNGDTFFPISLAQMNQFHEEVGASLSVALAWVSPADRYGVVEVEGTWVKAFREKEPRPEGWIYGGIALAEAGWWRSQAWEKHFSWEAYLMQAVSHLRIGAFLAKETPFIDIGVPTDYERAQTFVPLYALGR
ncbi:MAG: sugar phosphate nucleotidyltransferase [Bacteroidia bacterium]|nr:sugar phosphate nucleotidyltransferase [Bacteroidia bacterium]MDW8235980.1 sugar phosphate nucleotidyltransferase [Bacteroidia bacterium]